MSKDLLERIPAGHKRWRVIAQDPKSNPFTPRGPYRAVQTVDVNEGIPREQVERYAREAAQEMGYTFLELQAVA